MTQTFSAITWNILADAYIKPSRYPNCTPEDLEPVARRALVLDTVAELNADLLCLQEVEPDAFQDLAKHLQTTHKGVYAQRGGRPEGSAIFARTSLFQIVHHTTLRYQAQGDGQEAQIVILKTGDQQLAVASTHLKWQPEYVSPQNHVGRLQLAELLDKRAELAPNTQTWLIAGDFNAGIQSCVLEHALANGVDISCRAQRPWDTTNINGRRRKLDFLLRTNDLTPSPRPLGVKLGRSTPVMPSARRFASDHLPVTVDYTLRTA